MWQASSKSPYLNFLIYPQFLSLFQYFLEPNTISGNFLSAAAAARPEF